MIGHFLPEIVVVVVVPSIVVVVVVTAAVVVVVGIKSKVAVTVRFSFMVTVQLPVPEHPPPLQPAKIEPEAADAVSVTSVP